MAIELVEKQDGKVLEVRASGKLTREDYEQLVPEFERLIDQYGKINVLFDMHDFHGWQLGALWEDIKFDMRDFRDIRRVTPVCRVAAERQCDLIVLGRHGRSELARGLREA